MKFPTNQKLLLISAFVILFVTIISFYLYQGVLKSADEIIKDNKNITQTAVKKLILGSEQDLTPIWNEYLEGKVRITKQEERLADSLLSIDVKEILTNFHRLEGGFYFYRLDEFIGYSFPTIAEPKPAFGPPPRSYNIIRKQARSTIQTDSLITELHQFDPAIFPLSTKPIYVNGEIVGAAWARIHIERKLSTSQNIQSGTFFLTLGAILLGIFITIILVWTIKKRMAEIKEGLQKMKHDSSHRLKEYRGVLGVISKAINEMTDARQKEQRKRKKLEKELYQKDKMATLGKLIAGTAHEINTPISIIKTRIQIWERKLRKSDLEKDKVSLVSDKSLKIVHKEINRVSKLIKRLLLFSKPIGKEKKPVDIHAILKEKMDWLIEAFPGYTITYETDFDSNLPPVHADPDSIDQVISNIFKNSVQASTENCNMVIKTVFLEDSNLAKITIRDFGTGMPEEIKPKIFDPFFTTKNNGSGLGLSICNEIIKSHHGSIHFEKPQENETIIKTWDQSTAINNVQPSVGTICIIKLPIHK
ncbi:ATP-binding protein [Fodinibius sp. SL11]|uniref:ATP-binding protein n=1 Tax=Fodinibius sp. SL11 TaxID=3425690 RepID=UPI003F88044B